MKKEIMCDCVLNDIAYDDENLKTLERHAVCPECRERAATNERRMQLAERILNGNIEDRDLEQLVRLLDHLFGVNKDKALTAAGFYSLTPGKRKKIRRQEEKDYGPRLPDLI
jgi:hypothetical protein